MGAGDTSTVLLIEGMMSNRCRENVAERLGSVSGVKDVQVNLIRASAVVVHESGCQPSELVAVVVQAGYGAVVRA
jgi:copper chaperone CopZ